MKRTKTVQPMGRSFTSVYDADGNSLPYVAKVEPLLRRPEAQTLDVIPNEVLEELRQRAENPPHTDEIIWKRGD